MLPLDDRTIELFGARFRRPLAAPDEPPLHVPPADVAAAGAGRRRDRRAQLGPRRHDRPAGRRRTACSTRPAPRTPGVSVFVQDDRLVFDYNCFGDHHVVESDRDGAGRRVGRRRAVPPRRASGGTRRSSSTAQPCGAVDVPFVMSIISSIGPSVGYDHGSPVSDRYTRRVPVRGHARTRSTSSSSSEATGRRRGRRRRDERASDGPPVTMGTIRREVIIDRPPDDVWARDRRPARDRPSWFPGIVDAQVDGTTRVITTESGHPAARGDRHQRRDPAPVPVPR